MTHLKMRTPTNEIIHSMSIVDFGRSIKKFDILFVEDKHKMLA
jgi:hypothetical protein